VIRAFSFDGEGDALPIVYRVWPRAPASQVSRAIEYQERVGASKFAAKVSGTV